TKGRHFTYAAKQSGDSLAFTALLQPVSSAKSTPALTTRVTGNTIEITGEGWTDYLDRSEKISDLRFTLPSDKTPARITARLAVIRTTSAGIVSFIALDAATVELPGYSVVFEIARNLSGQRNPDGTWTISR
ncbi:MAG TPA: hypothetical protein VIO38_02005, partial [Rariglobus sp.]